MKRIHIVGCGPRSGTTLMAEAMIACFNIDRYTDHEDRIFTPEPNDGDIFLTKCPKDILVVRPLLKVNPDLYVICMIRDPRDMIVSKHGKDPDRYWAGLRYWKTYIPFWQRAKNIPRFITIKYEDFVSDPDTAQQTLLKNIPCLTMTAPFSRYHEVATPSKASEDALRGIRPIKPVGVGNYLKHLPRVAGQLQIHGDISEDLIDFGYEHNDDWTQLLNNVDVDLSASHWPEHFKKGEIRQRQRGMYKEVIRILLRRIGINPNQLKQRIGKH